MSPLPAFVLASVTVPVVMVAVGLVLAMLGLALLTGRRGPVATPDAAEAIDVTDPPPPCDWTAVLDRDDGHRTVLRPPAGRACCTYAVHVRDLDGVPDEVDTTREVLTWSGTDTRLGPRGAVTPMHWEVVTRRVHPAVGRTSTSLTVSRAPAPPVRTSPWRPQPAHTDAPPQPPVADPAELWRHHLDDLRAARAQPAPVDGPTLASLAHRRRIEIRVSVQRGCVAVPRTATVTGSCRVEVHGSASTPDARLDAAQVDSRVAVDDVEVVAARLAASAGTTPRSSVDHSRTTAADPDAVTVVVGDVATLEVGLPSRAADGATAGLHAAATAGVHLRLAPVPATDPAGCDRCVPVLEVLLGDVRPDQDPPAPSASSSAQLRLDGRSIALQPPAPDGASQSWGADVVESSSDASPQRPLPRARW